MKKWICMGLAAALALSLAACGSAPAADAGAASGDVSGPAVSDAAEGGDAASAPAASGEVVSAAANASIDEQVLLDDAENGIKVTAVSLSPESETNLGTSGWLVLKLLCENSSDNDYYVTVSECYVDGCAVSAYAKKTNLNVSMPNGMLEGYGITDIGKISVSFSVSNSESYDTIYDHEMLDVTASGSGAAVHAADFDGETIYDENGVTVKICPVIESIEAYSTTPVAAVLVENQSSSFVRADITDRSINDFMCDYGVYLEAPILAPGTLFCSNVMVAQDNLEDGILEDSNSLEFSLTLYDVLGYQQLAEVEGITADFTQ